MALKKLTTIRVFANDPDKKATHGNSNWKPYNGKEPADVVLRADVKHSVSVFQNEDGSMDVVINEKVVENYQSADSISDNIRQGGMRKLASSVEQSRGLTDDEVPF